MTEAVIVSTARTGLAKSWKGAFNMTHGATLGGHAVEHAVKRAGIEPASVETYLRRALANDDIKIKQYPGNAEPSPVSSTDSAGYRAIQQAVRQSFPDAVVAPGLMTAATDSRHFSLVSDAVFRFSPFRVKGEDLARFHGTNERLAISNYGEMIGFYHQLLRSTAAAPAP